MTPAALVAGLWLSGLAVVGGSALLRRLATAERALAEQASMIAALGRRVDTLAARDPGRGHRPAAVRDRLTVISGDKPICKS